PTHHLRPTPMTTAATSACHERTPPMTAPPLATSCPVCAELGLEPDHPDYPEPAPGDTWHGQYDPEHPEQIDRALQALDVITGEVYLAARYSRRQEMLGVRDVLAALGYRVTSRWI